MAPRNTSQKTKKNNSGFGCLLLLAFLILMIVLFMVNRETIAKNLKSTQFIEKILKKDSRTTPEKTVEPEAPKAPAPQKPSENPAKNEKPKEPAPVEKPVAETPKTAPKEQPPEPPKQTEKTTAAQKPPAKAPEKAAPVLRDRWLWFVRIDNDGVIARVRVQRSLPVSDSPLMDSMAALLKGPTASETKKGYSSLIPAGTKLLSATVRGTTAYLSFNDAFQFNSFGIEGYAAQLRQIVWTATEFDTVADVQILIEGRRVDYLGAEGIVIGGPLTRTSLERP